MNDDAGVSQADTAPFPANETAAVEPLITHQEIMELGGVPGPGVAECSFWSRPDGRICVQYFRPGENTFYHPHTHSEYVIVLCLAGSVAKTQMGQTCTVGPGEAMLGNFGVEHASAYLNDGNPCEAVCVSVDARMLAPFLAGFRLPTMAGSTTPVFLSKLSNPILHACAADIAQELRSRELGHTLVIEGLGLRMLVEALRSWPRAGVHQCEVDRTPRLPRREFVRAYEFMRWCRKDAFRLQRLCQFLGSSEERFTRLFLAATNSTPARFYNQMLVEHGRDLLHDPAVSIKEVSGLLGFKNCSHFIRSFRRQFGRSPQEFRRFRHVQ
jgi:AraC-like DNA-binding protein